MSNNYPIAPGKENPSNNGPIRARRPAGFLEMESISPT